SAAGLDRSALSDHDRADGRAVGTLGPVGQGRQPASPALKLLCNVAAVMAAALGGKPMTDHRLNVLAAAAALALAAVTPAAADDCCPAGYAGCSCEQFYLLNQGPVFSGPGHDLPRQVRDMPPPAYPY